MNHGNRKPNRLSGYDYGQRGAYFITVCTKDRAPILSTIENGPATVGANCVRLTRTGEIADGEIQKFNHIYPSVHVDYYVIMPNHIHMIVRIDDDGRTQFAPTISRIIKQFKGSVTKQFGNAIWQKSFYDHVIRDEEDYLTKAQYIEENPIKWQEDALYYS